MTMAGKSVLVTGANRGIGQALVEEALGRSAGRVYAGTRQPLAHPDGRVTPLTLDVTNAAQVQAAAERVGSLDMLVNNAGLALFEGLGDRAIFDAVDRGEEDIFPDPLAQSLADGWRNGAVKAFERQLAEIR